MSMDPVDGGSTEIAPPPASRLVLRDKLGWPVELIEGRPVTNFVRLLIHTSIWQTFKWRKGVPQDIRHLDYAASQPSTPASSK